MTDIGGIASERLQSFIDRIERLEEEKKALTDDIKDVFAQAKATGFDVKVMRQILKLRKLDTADRQEQEHLLELYKRALGMDGQGELFDPPSSVNDDDQTAGQAAAAE
jgi:uncharacterized protein (UPF0335 family)